MALSRIYLWLAVVWCGGAVMAFELAGARLLMPSFGMGVDVWASAIAAAIFFIPHVGVSATCLGLALGTEILAVGLFAFARGGGIRGRRLEAPRGGLPACPRCGARPGDAVSEPISLCEPRAA